MYTRNYANTHENVRARRIIIIIIRTRLVFWPKPVALVTVVALGQRSGGSVRNLFDKISDGARNRQDGVK